MIKYGLFVNNEWRDSHSGRFIEVENPATGQVIGTVPRGDAADAGAAVMAAKAALPGWRALTTVKKITLELGGKSPLILLLDVYSDTISAILHIVFEILLGCGATILCII